MCHADDPISCAEAGCSTCRGFIEDVEREGRRLVRESRALALVAELCLPENAVPLNHIAHLIKRREN